MTIITIMILASVVAWLGFLYCLFLLGKSNFNPVIGFFCAVQLLNASAITIYTVYYAIEQPSQETIYKIGVKTDENN